MNIENSTALIQRLEIVVAPLYDWLDTQSKDRFNANLVEGKWTIAQHVDHLIKSVQPINQAMNMPKLGLRTMFGKCKRAEMSYETISDRYKAELAAGGKAPKTFIPKSREFEQEKSIQKLKEVMSTLNENIRKWNEADLSKYQLPHPLLGKLSIREMMLFTAIHTAHHFKALKDNY